MTRVQRLFVGAVGVAFSAVGLFCLAALALVVIGALVLPEAGAAGIGVVLTAVAGLAAAAGGCCCAIVLNRRQGPPPRRASFIDPATEKGRHATGG
ncbi:hypothetical protein [Leifsonia aquatica]|uniref:hypothetical protein n=1 Tax=Leifsonia aquatica TaxID=144185 RepID=UPI00381ECA64